MIKIEDKPIVYCDVDSTLVMWREHEVPESQRDNFLILWASPNYKVAVWEHKEHVKMLKEFKARGHTVVVWSQGGSDWAESVVDALNLREIVDLVAPKPYWFFDDLTAEEFMPNSIRIWKDPLNDNSNNP